jgi:transposase
MFLRAPRLKKRKQNLLIKAWVLDTNQKQAAAIAGVNRNTALLFFRHVRELIYEASMPAPRFAGEVELDQAFFGNNKKAGGKHKKAMVLGADGKTYKVWRGPQPMKENRVLVFGIYNRGGMVYTHVIKHADRATLYPIIHMVLERGRCTIYTDKWRSYDDLGIRGYKHHAINHSQGYVGPRKGYHINSIENFWGFAKDRLTKFHGISRRTYPLHIKECEFRFNNRHNLEKAVKALLSPAPTIR